VNATPSSPSGMQPTCCGDLSPAERREFEEHLASCLSCQSAVSELTAHPGSAGSSLASGCGEAALVDDAPEEYRDSS
jgi:anti-sigma factor RsiW